MLPCNSKSAESDTIPTRSHTRPFFWKLTILNCSFPWKSKILFYIKPRLSIFCTRKKSFDYTCTPLSTTRYLPKRYFFSALRSQRKLGWNIPCNFRRSSWSFCSIFPFIFYRFWHEVFMPTFRIVRKKTSCFRWQWSRIFSMNNTASLIWGWVTPRHFNQNKSYPKHLFYYVHFNSKIRIFIKSTYNKNYYKKDMAACF